MIGIALEGGAQTLESPTRLVEFRDEEHSQAIVERRLFRRPLHDRDASIEDLREGFGVPDAAVEAVQGFEEFGLITDLLDGA